MFDPVRPLLDGIELITPDQRGFGGRPVGHAAPDLGAAVQDVIAVLDERQIQQAVIGGVSMGGYVALALLAEHPDRCAGLVLADTRSTADGEQARSGRLTTADSADAGQIATPADLVGPLLAPNTAEPIRTRAQQLAADAPAAAIAWSQRAMAGREDTTPELRAAAGNGLPVLTIVGELDTVTPPDEARALATAAAGPLVEIPGVGHLTPLEAPAAFAAAVRSFYADHRGRLGGGFSSG